MRQLIYAHRCGSEGCSSQPVKWGWIQRGRSRLVLYGWCEDCWKEVDLPIHHIIPENEGIIYDIMES